jgi:hypothetical protein
MSETTAKRVRRTAADSQQRTLDLRGRAVLTALAYFVIGPFALLLAGYYIWHAQRAWRITGTLPLGTTWFVAGAVLLGVPITAIMLMSLSRSLP